MGMGCGNDTLMYLTEQIHIDFLPHLTVHDMIAMVSCVESPHCKEILDRYIRDRINAFPSRATIADQSTPIQYISGETSGDVRTERWMFENPIYSHTLPVDTFVTILSTPLKYITIISPFIQYTHLLEPPEELQDRMAEWCVRCTRVASVWVYYSYDDYESLTTGTYYDFLNESYDHLVIRGIRITYNVAAMHDCIQYYMLGGIMPLIHAVTAANTKATVLFSGVWAVICTVCYYANETIRVVPQPTIF